jgi:hypothetical protein
MERVEAKRNIFRVVTRVSAAGVIILTNSACSRRQINPTTIKPDVYEKYPPKVLQVTSTPFLPSPTTQPVPSTLTRNPTTTPLPTNTLPALSDREILATGKANVHETEIARGKGYKEELKTYPANYHDSVGIINSYYQSTFLSRKLDSGTAIILDRFSPNIYYMLTVGHLVEEQGNFPIFIDFIQPHLGKTITLRDFNIAYHSESRLAIVAFKYPENDLEVFGLDNIIIDWQSPPNESVQAISFPEEGEFNRIYTLEGSVDSRTFAEGRPEIFIKASTSPGSSGTTFINSDKKLVGISRSIYIKSEGGTGTVIMPITPIIYDLIVQASAPLK